MPPHCDSDIEALFDRSKGVEDIDPDELTRMCREIRRIVSHECGATVRSIHVMGSYARGEAMDSASDLDLRLVCDDPPSEDVCARCDRLLRVEYGPQLRPNPCGYLDARISAVPPADDEPSVAIWRVASGMQHPSD